MKLKHSQHGSFSTEQYSYVNFYLFKCFTDLLVIELISVGEIIEQSVLPFFLLNLNVLNTDLLVIELISVGEIIEQSVRVALCLCYQDTVLVMKLLEQHFHI